MGERHYDLVPLQIENIEGLIAEADDALTSALRHCKKFPMVQGARKVKITIELKPSIHPATGETLVDHKSFVVTAPPKLVAASGVAMLVGDQFMVSPPEPDNQLDLIDFEAKQRASQGE